MLSVIVVAAGSGSRFGGPVKKTFLELAGKPLFLHCLETFRRLPRTGQLILALAEGDIPWVRQRFGAELDRLRVGPLVAGGAERRDTVANCLAHVDPNAELVAVHDAARPLTNVETISAVVDAADACGAALAAEPATSTIKRARSDGTVECTLPRSSLWAAQTPQIFRRSILLDAYARIADAGAVTDDAELVERLGLPVKLVASTGPNPKVTTPADLVFAEAWLARKVEGRS